jgi:membrane protein YqaA with SNARE-associated domain
VLKKRSLNAFAALWGFAEASVFFLVPDVLLSGYALSNLRRALMACLYAVAGALVGGTLIWFWGRHDPEAFRTLFLSLPGIDEAMIRSVRSQLESMGLAAVFLGPLKGTPYKIYALEASLLAYSWPLFVLISLPARLIRFVLVTLLVGSIRIALGKRLSTAGAWFTHLACWTLFYAWYFSALGAASEVP